ncbi:hypothetical protein L211DRAFT_673603 [Terfezia boudieri ATCC MYA-4762]|uniref:Uncharacterized protein n=1 Tax=Terfezia boudieri ATCC MYA-4762 TaxID=1051890 RepID=A0A3N4LBW0_9PEZI|nr:hypothetical protein L211DRAFT_673603 [Terfezia boudieri ATCC MYA-4762]
MPRSTQRSLLLAKILKMMEQLIRLIKHDGGKDLIEFAGKRVFRCSVGIWLAMGISLFGGYLAGDGGCITQL